MSDPWPPRPPRPPDERERRETAPSLEVPAGPETPASGGPETRTAAGPETPAAGGPTAADAARSVGDVVNNPTAPPIDGTRAEAGPARRSSANRRALGITALVVVGFLAIVVVVGGPAAAPGSPTFPPTGATTAPAGSAALATRGDVTAAFAAQGLQIEDVASAYRPAEAPRLAVAPRIVVRAVIPTDPEHGRVVIYEFVDSAAATVAAREQAAYVASGVGLVQFPPQTQFSLRVVGSTVVFYAWSSANAPDPGRVGAVATALAMLGFEVPVPN